MKRFVLISITLAIVLLQAALLYSYSLIQDYDQLRGRGSGLSPTSIPCSDIGDNGVITGDVTLTSDLYATSSPCITIAADSVTLDGNGFTIDGRGYFEGVISTGGFSNLVVRNCNFVGFYSYDLSFSGVGGGGVFDNNFFDSVRLGSSTSGVLLSGNLFNKGVRLQSDASFNVIDDNVFDMSGSRLTSVILDAPYNTISNNVFIGGNDEFGILAPGDGVGNVISGNNISGFVVGMYIHGDIVYIGSGYNVIENNTIVGNQRGIEIAASMYNEVSGNTIDSADLGHGDEIGIDIIDCWSNVISNNEIYDAVNEWELGCNLYCDNGTPNLYYNGLPACDDTLTTDCNPTCEVTLDDSSTCPLFTGWVWPEFTLQGEWTIAPYELAVNGELRYHAPGDGTEPVEWQIRTLGDLYRVSVHRFEYPDVSPLATNAMYIVIYQNGQDTVYVDWSQPGEEWGELGIYNFINDDSQGVVLSDLADGYVVADAIKIESLSRIAHINVERNPFLYHRRISP